MRSFCYFQLFVTWDFSAGNILSGKEHIPSASSEGLSRPCVPSKWYSFSEQLTSLEHHQSRASVAVREMSSSDLPRCRRISTHPGKVQTVFSELTNIFHISRQSVCKPGWHLPCPTHKQTSSCLKQEIQFLHVPFGALVDSVQGVSQHISVSCMSCTIPSAHTVLATSASVWQLATISRPGLPKGSSIISLLPAPLLPALWHHRVPVQHLLSQSTETLTLSAAVHSSNKDAIINWLRDKPQI